MRDKLAWALVVGLLVLFFGSLVEMAVGLSLGIFPLTMAGVGTWAVSTGALSCGISGLV